MNKIYYVHADSHEPLDSQNPNRKFYGSLPSALIMAATFKKALIEECHQTLTGSFAGNTSTLLRSWKLSRET